MRESDHTISQSSLKIWLLAARPRTLTAAVIPVMIGSALAYRDGFFNPTVAVIALICAFLLQIGSNLANDLFDYLSGADTRERKGPMRVVASGLVTPAQMKIALVVVFGLAFLFGLYLINIGGWPILVIGIASIIVAIAYTGGPYPLGYYGWGDLMVFLFFGLIGTVGTYYVQTLQLSLTAFLVSIPVGALITNILIVNNYRDVETDAQAGKRTTAVIFGKKFARSEFTILLFSAYGIPLFIWLFSDMSAWILLPFFSFPLGLRVLAMMNTLQGRELNLALEQTAKLVALYGILFAIGISV
jgi:1,4-dihydroxy-2-naphthoate polyprenyltransferase